MKRSLICLMVTVLLVSALTGCWNRRELNEVAIAMGMSIDAAPHNQYRVAVQVVVPSQVSSKTRTGEMAQVTTYEATHNSVLECIRQMSTVSPRKIYFSHLRILIIGEKLAKQGVAGALELLSRDQEFRNDFYVALGKGHPAENFLKVLTPLVHIPAEKLFDSLDNSSKVWAPTVGVPLSDFLYQIIDKGRQPVLTTLEIKGNGDIDMTSENVKNIDTPTVLEYTGLSIFNKEKLIGYMDQVESKGYNYITGNVRNAVGSVPCEDEGHWVIEVLRAKTNIESMLQHGKPAFSVYIAVEANVAELKCKLDLSDPEVISKMEGMVEEHARKTLLESIRKAKELKADVFGFGQVLHRQHPKVWKPIASEWDQHFTEVDIAVNFDVTLRRTGTVNRSFMSEM
ncbi:Ger(x)C family spore germination protein [Marinicrinis sediminis]|uniref:Ger(X)C family spore germination protein n=1 Tax=Marinicrinis sediminis TaxID=1652465 RepID=A0ABW5R8Q9_9BACL